jgi:hypothetical protein
VKPLAGSQKKALEACSKGLSGMISTAVGREDLERQLEMVRALAPGEMEGVFGPDSLTWRIDREALTFHGAGRRKAVIADRNRGRRG